MENLARLAVHDLRRRHHPAAEGGPDRLVAEAHPEDRHRAGEVPDGLDDDARVFGAPRPGGNEDERGGQRLDIPDGDGVVADDPQLLAITAGMPEGTGLLDFSQNYPESFFDVGISEGHAVAFAAGLAAGGRRPVFAEAPSSWAGWARTSSTRMPTSTTLRRCAR